MQHTKRFLMVLLALMLLVSSTGAAAAAPEQQNCRSWHTVRYGQSLSSIGAWYGVSWPYLAQVNNIGRPYTIYTGTVLCIPTGTWNGGGQGGIPVYNAGGRTWSFSVTNVVANANVTVQTLSFPSNVFFEVRFGRWNNTGQYDWVLLPEKLDTGNGGATSYTFNIPASLSGANQLVLRLTQNKKNGRSFHQDVAFYNVAGGQTGGQVPPIYNPPVVSWGIPTIWIVRVRQNSSVTIQTHNFPPGLNFEVLMGAIGTRGVGGYYAGTLNSGAGGTLVAEFPIPAQLQGLNQISIRTQNWPTGYHSYNWFYNNNAY